MKRKNRVASFFIPIFKKQGSYSKEYYEGLLDKYKDVSSYSNLLNCFGKKQGILTNEDISISKKCAFGTINTEYIIKKFGKPNYKIRQNDHLLNIDIFLYRIFIGNHKTKFELHFFKDNLFFYNYIFSYLSEEEKSEVIKILEKKYLNGNKFNYLEEYIVDDNQSVIIIDDKIDFVINYICYKNSGLFNNLPKIIKMLEDEKRNEYDKTIYELFKRL